MEIHFFKFSPTQNITLLIPDRIARDEQAAIATRLMQWDGVAAEQVGFLEEPTLSGARARLQMMGGEFCGNAAMSLGTLFAIQDGLSDGDKGEYVLEVSGREGPVNCTILRKAASYEGTVSMPLPKKIERVHLTSETGPIEPYAVFFEGITHIMLSPDYCLSEDIVESRIASWCRDLGADALGVIFTPEDQNAIKPLVYVQETHSLCWEHGCGSGTAALGCLITMLIGADTDLCVTQPGGQIRVSTALRSGHIERVEITGTVRLLAEGTAYL